MYFGKENRISNGLDIEYETKKEDKNAISMFGLSNWRERSCHL